VLLALIALAGVCILVPSFKLDDRITQGVLWGVASGLTFALLALVNRKYVQEYSGITIALYQDAFAALALLPFAFAYPPSLGAREWLLLVILGVLFTAVAHALFIAGLHGIRARTASMIACLEPVYGAALAALLLREIPSVHTAAGGLVILGVAFYATVTAGTEEAGGKGDPAANPPQSGSRSHGPAGEGKSAV
jgi:drug/metabolite transporter (DMT)-like permease